MFSIKILDFNDKKLLTNGRNCDIIIPVVKRGCSSMAESQPSKLVVWVRFPSPAPKTDVLFGCRLFLLPLKQ